MREAADVDRAEIDSGTDDSKQERVSPLHLIASIESARYEQRVQKSKKTQRLKAVARVQLNREPKTQKQKQKREFSQDNAAKLQIASFRYEVAVGIQQASESPAAYRTRNTASQGLAGNSVRQRVTYDYNGSADGRTNSAVSNSKLRDSSAQASDFKDLIVTQPVITKTQIPNSPANQTHQPTIISLIDSRTSLPTLSTPSVENLFLGTPTNRAQPRYATGFSSIKNLKAEVVIDQLIKHDEESEEVSHLSKLRQLLTQAMVLSKTSTDKAWKDMTIFERAQLKECFAGLLNDLSKEERRGNYQARRAPERRELTKQTKMDVVQQLKNCLTSHTMRKSSRPLKNSPSVETVQPIMPQPIEKVIKTVFTTLGARQLPHDFILIDNNECVSLALNKASWGRDSRLVNKRNSQTSLDLSDPFTPKFIDKKKLKLKDKASSGTRKLLKKSQGTDTQLEGFVNQTETVRNSSNQPSRVPHQIPQLANYSSPCSRGEPTRVATELRSSNLDLISAKEKVQMSEQSEIGRCLNSRLEKAVLLDVVPVTPSSALKIRDESAIEQAPTPSLPQQPVHVASVPPVAFQPSKILNFLQRKIPKGIHLQSPQEEPSQIVESTLKTISLTLQHQCKQLVSTQTPQVCKANSDIPELDPVPPLTPGLAKQNTSTVRYKTVNLAIQGLQSEKIEEKESEYQVSFVNGDNIGSIPVFNSNFQLFESDANFCARSAAQMNPNQPERTFTKSPTQMLHTDTFMNQETTPLPSQTLIAVDSATEKSSLNPTYLLAKLGESSDTQQRTSHQDNCKNFTLKPLPQQHAVDQSGQQPTEMRLQGRSEQETPAYQVKEAPRQTLRAPPHKQNRAPTIKLSPRKNQLSGWEDHLQNGPTPLDITIIPLKREKEIGTPNNQFSSVQAKLHVLEKRLQDYKLDKLGGSPQPEEGSAMSSPGKLQMSPHFTHSVLRRSDLKRRAANDMTFGRKMSPVQQTEGAGALAVRLCGIKGQRKAIAKAELKKLHPKGGASSGTISRKRSKNGSVEGQSGQPPDPKAKDAVENHVVIAFMTEETPHCTGMPKNQRFIEVAEIMYQHRQRHVSSDKLQSQPQKQINRVRLEVSSSNPSMQNKMEQKGTQLTIENHSLYKVNYLAESANSHPSSPFKGIATQAQARTPSKVSLSEKSLQINSADTATNLAKTRNEVKVMSLTDRTGFLPHGSQELRNELHQVVLHDPVTTSQSNSEDGEPETRVTFRATMTFNDGDRQSYLQYIDQNVNNVDAACSAKERQSTEPHRMISDPSSDSVDMASQGKRYIIGNRSQSLAPPILTVKVVPELRNPNLSVISPSNQSLLRSLQEEEVVNEPVFSKSVAPRKQLPKMKCPTLIQGGGAPLHLIKQDTRTPLHKLLTSAQLEEFMVMIGSQTTRCKFKNKRGPDFFSHSVTQPTGRIDHEQQAPHLPSLKLPQVYESHPNEFSSFSKQHTVEHLKRMQQIQATRETKVVFIDPLLGAVQPEMQQTHQAMKTRQARLTSEQKQMMMTSKINSIKPRANPFHVTGPFSHTSPQSTATSALKRESDTDRITSSSILGHKLSSISERYPSLKPRRSKDPSRTFIFNDINNLAHDLRKNSVLVEPLFKRQM